MSQLNGQSHIGSWRIFLYSAGSRIGRTPSLRISGKILAGSFAGLFFGLVLSLLVEPQAHADLSEIRQHTVFQDFLKKPMAAVTPDDKTIEQRPLSREQLHLHAESSDDYRYRIPAWQKPERKQSSIAVVATAYNNVPAQTDDTPDIAAWGDRIEPGMPLIAVSRDLLKMGLKRGMKVRISGLEGEFIVLDKMNKRYRKRIDIYMGKNVVAARGFGKRRVMLSWLNDKALADRTLIASR